MRHYFSFTGVKLKASVIINLKIKCGNASDCRRSPARRTWFVLKLAEGFESTSVVVLPFTSSFACFVNSVH